MFGFYRVPWLQEQSCDWVCKYLVFRLSQLGWQLTNGLSLFLIITKRKKVYCFKANNWCCSTRQENIFNSGGYTFYMLQYVESSITSKYLQYLASFVITANQGNCFVHLYCIQWLILKCQLPFIILTSIIDIKVKFCTHTGKYGRYAVTNDCEIYLAWNWFNIYHSRVQSTHEVSGPITIVVWTHRDFTALKE